MHLCVGTVVFAVLASTALEQSDCWLADGFSANLCCDQHFGPKGFARCWDRDFTFDFCCMERTAHPLLSALVSRVFDQTIILCYKGSCERHMPGSGYWPLEAQQRIILQDGEQTDIAYSHVFRRIGSSHHRRALVSHLAAVERVSHLDIANVLLLEDDVHPSSFLTMLPQEVIDVIVEGLAGALPSAPWQVLKLGANYGHVLEADRCQQCRCEDVAWWPGGTPTHLYPSICRTRRERCDIRSSVAYAVQRSAFKDFSELLLAIRNDSAPRRLLGVDMWVPKRFHIHHLLPSVVVQVAKPYHEGTSLTFRERCIR